MRLSWKLGRVAGIDLFLHPSAFLVWLIVASATGAGLLDALPFTLALLSSIVLHELGHALMARRYGIGTRDITLYLIGGVARLNRMPRSAGPELLIALAGPAVNVAIATVTGLLLALGLGSRFPESLIIFLIEILNLNIGLVLFNLLPIFPMDGGRVLRAALTSWLGRPRATEVAAGLGQFLAIIGGVIGVFAGRWELAILATFVYFAAATERAQVSAEVRHRERATQEFADPPAPPTGFRWADRGDGVWRLVPIIGPARTWGQS